MRKIQVLLLLLVLALASMIIPSYADDTFNVTVPTSLPIYVASDGSITCSQSGVAQIINGSSRAVEITSINVTPNTSDGWSLIEYGSSMTEEQVNTKSFGFQILENNVATNGSVNVSSLSGIGTSSYLPVTYAAAVGTFTSGINNVEIAKVTFTVSFAPIQEISFTIDGTEYVAEAGSTWNDWINSEYNRDSFDLDEDNYVVNSEGEKIVDENEAYVINTYDIEDGGTYTGSPLTLSPQSNSHSFTGLNIGS